MGTEAPFHAGVRRLRCRGCALNERFGFLSRDGLPTSTARRTVAEIAWRNAKGFGEAVREVFRVRKAAVGGDLPKCPLARADQARGLFQPPVRERLGERLALDFPKPQFRETA